MIYFYYTEMVLEGDLEGKDFYCHRNNHITFPMRLITYSNEITSRLYISSKKTYYLWLPRRTMTFNLTILVSSGYQSFFLQKEVIVPPAVRQAPRLTRLDSKVNRDVRERRLRHERKRSMLSSRSDKSYEMR